MLWNNICRYPRQLNQLESVEAESDPACSHWQPEAHTRSPVDQPRPRSRRAERVLTITQRQEKKLWVNIAICLVSLRPSVSHTTETSTSYERIKNVYILIKKFCHSLLQPQYNNIHQLLNNNNNSMHAFYQSMLEENLECNYWILLHFNTQTINDK